MAFSFPRPRLSSLRKGFVKFLTLLGGFVFFFFFTGFILGAVTDNRRQPLPDHIVLSLELNGQFIEKQGMPSLSTLLTKPSPTLHQITRTLDRAAQDERVKGLYLRIQNGDYGLAHIQEFRDAIRRFQSSGKFVYAYSNSFGGFGSAMGEYHIATIADEIWMQPVGSVGLTGYSLEMPFLRGVLDKIGIEPEVLGKGKYKSAPETFARKEASPANEEMTRSLLNNLSEQFMHDVSLDRDVTLETMKSLMIQSPMTDLDALKGGLVDSLGYWDEFIDHIENQTPEETQAVNLARYAHSLKKLPKKTIKFAFIQASGAIGSISEGGVPPLSSDLVLSEEIWDAFVEARDNADIQAIIFRIDSPGGSPVASETIRRALVLAQKEKPVIVSMGNSAASGGYWIAAEATKIIAQPATLTGSIGVFAVKPNLSPLWEKLDIQWQEFNQNEKSGIWSPNSPLKEEEREHLQTLIDHTYDQFITRVADGRGMNQEAVEKLAQGRVWTGEQALQNNLVDGLGGVETAVLEAKELLNIEAQTPIMLVAFPKPLSPFERLLKLADESFVAIPSFLKLSLKLDQVFNQIKTMDFYPLVK